LRGLTRHPIRDILVKRTRPFRYPGCTFFECDGAISKNADRPVSGVLLSFLYPELIARVEEALLEPLPGRAAHVSMAPRPPRPWPAGDPSNARHAAGLLLLFPRDGRAHLVLTLRADTLDRHGGQVSLPGGALDPGETCEQAALREAREEIGLETGAVRVLGALTPIDIAVSGFRLHPIVAAIDREPALSAASGEVARILTPPVERFLRIDAVTTRIIRRNDMDVAVPTFLSDQTEIWGATAMILAEFLDLIRI
jgi:8-oxo-dGTP pyrophosphatase MutT (NUDIX family)